MKFLILAVPLGLLAALLISPYTLVIRGTKKGQNMDFRLQILLWRLGIFRKKFKGADKEKGEEFEFKRLIELARRALIARRDIMDLAGSVLSSINLQRLELTVDVASDDLAGTAELSGYLWTISALTAGVRNVEIMVRPDFSGNEVNGVLELSLRVTPLKPLLTFLMLLRRRTFREFISGLRSFS